ncbi:alkylation response protein AidB-like acyl-CoA dehydrogenase [Kitasatospora sp. MAP12-15]|uniref:acyl-CoA dehydrogenase n=1 Tax=unclassified Kitasatospora TaxID=2633591 RepID=UPI0024772CC4|nr:acyl-CoA dehydrogenase [Kitasatospora sp. MAP12-44]MDH6111058.1 alkylation response protein AidB-like acyl-CoA dehydrogenase [Kitasatospora sp. MAP12-44]
MTLVQSLSAAEQLESVLGDPWQPANPYGFAAGVQRDLLGRFPTAFARELRRNGFQLSCLPTALGGTLASMEQTLLLIRTAARRDANAMPATLFSVSAVMAVLAAGDAAQRELVASWVAQGSTLAFALSEEHAGSDVLANTCRLRPAPGGWLLKGTKWLVGRASDADAVFVVARTGERGPGAFSAVLLGPEQLADPRVRRRLSTTTTGMRGVDFADLSFEDCPVPAQTMVGRAGEGLAGALRAQQVVRLMSTAGCLATADTALRTALRFAGCHRVGGRPVVELPYAERELAVAAAELCAADLTGQLAGRLLHLAPARFGLSSSVVKRVATLLTGSVIRRCRSVLGARAVLVGGPGAVLDKAARDNAMVEVIDTSALGNLRAIALQLPGYATRAGSPAEPAGLFELGTSVPELDPSLLDLGVRPTDPVLHGLFGGAAAIAEDLRAAAVGGDPAAARAAELVMLLAESLERLFAQAAEAQRDPSRALRCSAELLDLADRLCPLYAAAVAAQVWRANRGRALYGGPPGAADWLTAVLEALLATADGRDPRQAGPAVLPAYRRVAELLDTGRLFTALPHRLAESWAEPTDPAPDLERLLAAPCLSKGEPQ